MKKVIWSVEQVQSNRVWKVEDVISITFNNYSPYEVTLEVNGVKRNLPALDTISNIPTPFVVEMHGYLFDVEAKITFQNAQAILDGTTIYDNLIIDYAKIKTC